MSTRCFASTQTVVPCCDVSAQVDLPRGRTRSVAVGTAAAVLCHSQVQTDPPHDEAVVALVRAHRKTRLHRSLTSSSALDTRIPGTPDAAPDTMLPDSAPDAAPADAATRAALEPSLRSRVTPQRALDRLRASSSAGSLLDDASTTTLTRASGSFAPSRRPGPLRCARGHAMQWLWCKRSESPQASGVGQIRCTICGAAPPPEAARFHSCALCLQDSGQRYTLCNTCGAGAAPDKTAAYTTQLQKCATEGALPNRPRPMALRDGLARVAERALA